MIGWNLVTSNMDIDGDYNLDLVVADFAKDEVIWLLIMELPISRLVVLLSQRKMVYWSQDP